MMNKYGFAMLNESNAQELTQIAEEVGALAFRGQLQYPGPETGDWEIGTDVIPDILYELRDREVLLILAPVEGGEQVHLCGICGFVRAPVMASITAGQKPHFLRKRKLLNNLPGTERGRGQ